MRLHITPAGDALARTRGTLPTTCAPDHLAELAAVDGEATYCAYSVE